MHSRVREAIELWSPETLFVSPTPLPARIPASRAFTNSFAL